MPLFAEGSQGNIQAIFPGRLCSCFFLLTILLQTPFPYEYHLDYWYEPTHSRDHGRSKATLPMAHAIQSERAACAYI
jgi:hypothetical protein